MARSNGAAAPCASASAPARAAEAREPAVLAPDVGRDAGFDADIGFDANMGAARAVGSDAQPLHVAVIMDGNGRWAKARGLPRLAGHRRGVEAVRGVVRACPELGVDALTLYAFSTENWRRPAEEVSGLMELFRFYLTSEAAQLAREGVRVVFLGDRSPLAPDLQELMVGVERLTAAGRALTVAVAVNYGGRAEIVAAARRLAAQAAEGGLSADAVDEAAFDAAIDRRGLPDPDLIIRTSGEQRLSNFLLWQAAYSELVFVPETWPEFSPEVFRRALGAYRARDRRFGAVAG